MARRIRELNTQTFRYRNDFCKSPCNRMNGLPLAMYAVQLHDKMYVVWWHCRTEQQQQQQRKTDQMKLVYPIMQTWWLALSSFLLVGSHTARNYSSTLSPSSRYWLRGNRPSTDKEEIPVRTFSVHQSTARVPGLKSVRPSARRWKWPRGSISGTTGDKGVVIAECSVINLECAAAATMTDQKYGKSKQGVESDWKCGHVQSFIRSSFSHQYRINEAAEYPISFIRTYWWGGVTSGGRCGNGNRMGLWAMGRYSKSEDVGTERRIEYFRNNAVQTPGKVVRSCLVW